MIQSNSYEDQSTRAVASPLHYGNAIVLQMLKASPCFPFRGASARAIESFFSGEMKTRLWASGCHR